MLKISPHEMIEKIPESKNGSISKIAVDAHIYSELQELRYSMENISSSLQQWVNILKKLDEPDRTGD